jgi:AraC-like DNA-binding protein
MMNYRLQKAKYKMAHTSLSIGEIAHAVGFTSQSYFSKVFKEMENISPNEYRKNIR